MNFLWLLVSYTCGIGVGAWIWLPKVTARDGEIAFLERCNELLSKERDGLAQRAADIQRYNDKLAASNRERSQRLKDLRDAIRESLAASGEN